MTHMITMSTNLKLLMQVTNHVKNRFLQTLTTQLLRMNLKSSTPNKPEMHSERHFVNHPDCHQETDDTNASRCKKMTHMITMSTNLKAANASHKPCQKQISTKTYNTIAEDELEIQHPK